MNTGQRPAGDASSRSPLRFWPRLDTLFARLIAAQMGLLLLTVMVVAALSTVERNTVQLAQLVQRWLPAAHAALRAAASGATASDTPLPPGLHWQLAMPADMGTPVDVMPIARRAKQLMADEGLIVGRTYTTLFVPRDPLVTMELLRPGTTPIWVQVRPFGSLPPWPAGVIQALALLLVLALGITWAVVRHVTRPLQALSLRLRQQAQPGAVLEDPLPPDPRARQGTAEIREMDAAYAALLAQLHRQERERALLLAGVSHDLRSPLARIRLAAEMLPETPDNADGVAAVTRNVDVADRLIASFLEFVRTGTHPMNETVDAAAVVTQAVATMDRTPSDLQTRVPERLLLHQASALLLERLVVNLVDNAIKHGGLPVQVQLTQMNRMLELSVIDSGPGLPPGAGDTLLEAFARGDASRGVPGFGLGLAIVQQIVTRLQGQLRFERSPAGHAVTVLMPLSR